MIDLVWSALREQLSKTLHTSRGHAIGIIPICLPSILAGIAEEADIHERKVLDQSLCARDILGIESRPDLLNRSKPFQIHSLELRKKICGQGG